MTHQSKQPLEAPTQACFASPERHTAGVELDNRALDPRQARPILDGPRLSQKEEWRRLVLGPVGEAGDGALLGP